MYTRSYPNRQRPATPPPDYGGSAIPTVRGASSAKHENIVLPPPVYERQSELVYPPPLPYLQDGGRQFPPFGELPPEDVKTPDKKSGDGAEDALFPPPIMQREAGARRRNTPDGEALHPTSAHTGAVHNLPPAMPDRTNGENGDMCEWEGADDKRGKTRSFAADDILLLGLILLLLGADGNFGLSPANRDIVLILALLFVAGL